MEHTISISPYARCGRSIATQSIGETETSMKLRTLVIEPLPHSRDSGVFLSEDEESCPSILASPGGGVTSTGSDCSAEDARQSLAVKGLSKQSRSLPLASSHDKKTPQKSELELQYDRVRNAQFNSKQCLKSPTQLLKDRLDPSPKTKGHAATRNFLPPRASSNICIMPGPPARTPAFVSTDVCARTETGRPAWWCKTDRVVVLDGLKKTNDGALAFRTRSSKGLSAARRNGVLETIIILLECLHCHDMLNRSEWKCVALVCERSVCWNCRQRCQWELERAHGEGASNESSVQAGKVVRLRDRADSVMEQRPIDERLSSEDMGLEQILKC